MKTWRLLHHAQHALHAERLQNINAYNALFEFAISVQYLKTTKKPRGGKPEVQLVTVLIAKTSKIQKIVVLLRQHPILALLLLMKREGKRKPQV